MNETEPKQSDQAPAAAPADNDGGEPAANAAPPPASAPSPAADGGTGALPSSAHPAADTAAKPSGSNKSLLFGAIAVAALAGVGYLTSDEWLPLMSGGGGSPATTAAPAPAASPAPPPATAVAPGKLAPVGDPAALVARIAELEQAVARLKEQVEQASAPGAQLARNVDAMGQRIARLEQMGAEIGALDQRLGNVETQAVTTRIAATTTDRAAAVVAANQLAMVARGSGPFQRELGGLRELAGDDQTMIATIKQLEPLSATGTASLVDLQVRFPAMARDVVQASWRAQGGTWLDRTVNRLTSLVTVRQTGPAAVAAGGVDGALARAETAVGAGDLPGAIAALEALSGSMAQEAANSWLVEASNRVAVDGQIGTLQQRAVARLMNRQG